MLGGVLGAEHLVLVGVQLRLRETGYADLGHPVLMCLSGAD
jgi:hypothetical protein